MKRSTSPAARARGGFTLIEMVVATVVLAVGVVGALSVFGVISRASATAAEYDQAALLAERRLAEVEALGSEGAVSDSGDFGEEFPGYRWEQEVLETEHEGLQELRLTVEWGSEQSRRGMVVATYVFAEL